MMQNGFFGVEKRLNRLSELGDPLEKLNAVIDWELFRPVIDQGLAKMKTESKEPGTQSPFDSVMMFKILVLARLYNLSDDQTEYLIADRLSFLRFLGLSLGERVPDAKTIRLLRDTLTKAGVMEKLFTEFDRTLEKKGLIACMGSFEEAIFVYAPGERNSREENKVIKE